LAAHELQRILYVEDEPDIQAVAKIALEDVGGFTLMTCASGQEALEQAAEFNPDLFLLDVMMPRMDGPATLQALRAIRACAKIPAMFMTAKVQTHETEALRSLGAIDVIAKPFDPMRLAEVIRRSWQRHHQ
jgi:CheY-like chemotaxis protein